MVIAAAATALVVVVHIGVIGQVGGVVGGNSAAGAGVGTSLRHVQHVGEWQAVQQTHSGETICSSTTLSLLDRGTSNSDIVRYGVCSMHSWRSKRKLPKTSQAQQRAIVGTSIV